jgi:protoporphyrinogen oxidase
MTEQSAFGRANGAPAGETVLSFDFYDDPGGPFTRAAPEDLFEHARPTLEAFGVGRDEVRSLERLVASDAYPVLASGYRCARDRALDGLASIDGLLSAGRGGLFLHVNQHHAIEMGVLAGRTALLSTGSARAWRLSARRFEAFRVVD